MRKMSLLNPKRQMRSLLPALLFSLAAVAPTSCVDISAAETFQTGNHVKEWRDEIIYQVLIDRFADGDPNNDYRMNRAAPARYHGGDWRGLADRLNYLSELGVTTIWISPIVKNVETDAGIDGYHGYWAQDLELLNPHFGNLEDLRDLIRRAHQKDMKVVLDIVTNHMGQLFFYDINMNGRPDINVAGGIKTTTTQLTEYDPDYESPEVQAFTSLGPAGPAPIVFMNDPIVNRIPPSAMFLPGGKILGRPEGYHRRGRIVNYDKAPDGTEQTMFGDFPGGLKDIATERDDVRRYMVDAYARWIELTDLDGFRIDTVKHVEHEFWQIFAKGIRERAKKLGKDKFLMFGEVFDGKDDLVGSFTKDNELDSLFDFPQYYQVFQDVFVRGVATTKVEERWKSRKTNWSSTPPALGVGVAPVDLHVNFLDNHDVGRFLWVVAQAGRSDGPAVLRNALTFLLTEPGIPCIYYGTEQEFSGGNDPANREDLFIGPDGDINRRTDGLTFKYIAKLTRLRKSNAAMRRGEFKFTWTTSRIAGESDAGILSFERTLAGDPSYALVVINTHKDKPSAPVFEGKGMTVSAPPGTVLVDVINGGSVTVGGDGKVLVEPLPATTARVFVPQGQEPK